jgi:hypothetical protein
LRFLSVNGTAAILLFISAQPGPATLAYRFLDA